MSRKRDLLLPSPRLPAEKTEEVLAELERVLGSSVFRNSRRCQSLLRKIVEHTLAGEIDRLKERALGVEVFGRPPDYDTSLDPVVRASAAEIRKKLAQYYQESGHESEAHIDLPPGSYLAEFHFASERPGVEIPEAPIPVAPLVIAKPGIHRRLPIVLVVSCLCVGVLAASLTEIRGRHSDLDDLWAPMLKSPGMVLVCVGLQAAFNFTSAREQDEIQGITRQARKVSGERIPPEDLVLLRDRYVALDDALCLVRLTSLLEKYRKAYRIRGEGATSFADLRDTPAVLIGAFSNPWTLRTADQLRFTFRKDSEHDTGMVYDRQHPDNTQWKLANYWPNWDVPVDYAIVTRMVDSTSDRPVMIAAGLTQYGTIGAGEFLSSQEYFSEAVRRLPGSWQKKNLQIVLSVPVVNRISGRPRVLATHVW
jgi:hypothetical protein